MLLACKPERDTADLFFYQTDSLRSGDLILRRGYGLVSDIIVAQLNDSIDISHCGIVLKDSTGKLVIIHSLSKMVSDHDGMQSCNLDKFIEDSRIGSVKIYRFKNVQSAVVADYAQYYLQRQIPFDTQFNQNDSSAFYCSELPIHIIKTAFGIDVSHAAYKPKFSVFTNPEYFEEVAFVYSNKE